MELTAKARPARRGWRYSLAATAVAVIGLALWIPGPGRLFLAQSLLERAYAQDRTLPLRFAGAGYGPEAPVRRGAANPAPAPLLEAEGLLAGALAAHPDDARLLQARAHAELLQGSADAALNDLQRAQVLAPALPALQVDLASAYFERATAGHDPDYGTALDELSQVLVKQPRDPIALFNRALVEEALEDWTGAADDWAAYLQIDPSGAWATEARTHLKAAMEKVQHHDAAFDAPLLTPAAFVALPQVAAVVDARPEDYLMTATTAWLPAAYPLAGRPDAVSLAAARRLGAWLQQQHHDRWLADMLGAPASPSAAQGLADLRQAIEANGDGQPDAARTAARQAEVAFEQAASPAGRARAEYEEVYALHRAETGRQCMAVAEQLLPTAASHSYGWLKAEGELEESDCSGLVGRPNPTAITQAEAVSAADGYRSVEMRAAGYAAASDADPASEASWRANRDLLAAYWGQAVIPYRAYQSELLLGILSSERGQWCAGERLGRAALERLDRSSEVSYQAMARQQYAAFAERCGYLGAAQQARKQAAALFARLPPTPATENLEAFNELDLAEVEMQQGQAAAARQELSQFRAEQPPGVSLARALPYFEILGRLDQEAGREREAGLETRAAIAISESDLRSYAGDAARQDQAEPATGAYRAWLALQWSAKHDATAALEYWEWTRATPIRASRPLPAAFLAAARTYDAAEAPEQPEPDAVRQALPALQRKQVVSYLLLPDQLLIWEFDNRGIHAAAVPVARATIETAAAAFAAACAVPGPGAAQMARQGQQLSAWLLAPVARWLDPARVLVVEPDGGLGAVPFEALPAPGGGAWRQPVVQSPGLDYAALAHVATAPWDAARVLAVGNPALSEADDGAFPPLPAAAAEARQVGSAFTQATILIGTAATAAAVEQVLPSATVFHFAGHAEGGQLLLADGGALTAADFTQGSLARCQLAVLDACSTGGASAVFNASALVRAALRAGVPDVIATRWPVDSAVACQFSQYFYAALRAGMSVPRALFTAQTQLRAQPATAAPYYWAGFADYGASDQ